MVVYKSPIDYVPPGDTTNLAATATRDIVLTVEFQAQGATQWSQTEVRPKLRRPPVVLSHGLWSDSTVWDGLSAQLSLSQRFVVEPFDYRDTASSSFAFNAARAARWIEEVQGRMREFGFACAQVDWVGHSMGGILPRVYHSYGIHGRGWQWHRTDNYGAGDIHKLILLNSPQHGSPIADLLVQADEWSETVTRWILASADMPYGGAIFDLQRGSSALRELGTTPIPTWSLVGTGGRVAVGGVSVTTKAAGLLIAAIPHPVAQTIGKSLTFIGRLLPGAFAAVFDLEEHDLLVAESSQEAGLSQNHVTVDSDPIGSLHTSVTSDSQYQQRVEQLLNAPTATFAPSIPAPALPTNLQRLAVGSTPVLGLAVANQPPIGTNPGVVDLFVSGLGGFAPSDVDLLTPWGVLTSAGPYQFSVSIPSGTVGPVQFLALASDAGGAVAYSMPLEVDLGGLGALQQFTARHPTFSMRAPLEQARMTVEGTYSSGIVRDLTNANHGTAFASSNPSVATVDADGILTAWEPGVATISATRGGFVATATIEVEFSPIVGYGTNTTGSGGIRPTIGANRDAARSGDTGFAFDFADVNGGAFGLLVAGWKPARIELGDIKLWIDLTNTLTFSFFATNPTGGPGAGTGSVGVPIPADPFLVGLPVYWQGLFLDNGAGGGVACTWGVVTTLQAQ